MALHEIKVEIPTAAADAANDVLLEHSSENWTVLEDAIARRAWVVGICGDEPEAQAQWSAIASRLTAVGVAPVDAVVSRALADTDWRDSYKAHFHAWQFGRLHWVPAWERGTFKLPPGDAVLWLDPGLAFGTGNHETTRLCVERLVALAAKFQVSSSAFRIEDPGAREPETRNSEPKNPNPKQPLRVIDAGCGSGILTLSAALLGFGDITGFDNDPEAVRVSEENAALNGLAGRVKFLTGDLIGGLAGRPADVVLANIQADVLMRFARELAGAVAPGGTLVLSGILAPENAQVRTAFAAAAPGWAVDSRVMGEWSDVQLVRPA